jgi:Phosphodiester glycosidase
MTRAACKITAMRKRNVALCVLLMLSAVIGAFATSPGGDMARFRTVAPGIEHATFQVEPRDAEPFSGHAFKIDLDVAKLRLIPAGGPSARRRVEEIVASYPAVVAINASFFDRDGQAMGLAIYDGRPASGNRLKGWGALVISDRARIVLGADIDEHPANRLVVQGIPRLVVDGKVTALKPQIAERTAVCAEGSSVILVVSTRAEATPFARFLAEPLDKGGLGCSNALNLDGGPSTQLLVRLPSLALSFAGGWGVPNALVVSPGVK